MHLNIIVYYHINFIDLNCCLLLVENNYCRSRAHLDLLNTAAKITGFLRVVAQGSSRSSHAGVFRNNVQLGRKSGFHCTHCGGGRPCGS